MFGVFGVFGVFWLMTFGKDQKGDQGGRKISGGVKPDIFKRAAQIWPKFWVG